MAEEIIFYLCDVVEQDILEYSLFDKVIELVYDNNVLVRQEAIILLIRIIDKLS